MNYLEKEKHKEEKLQKKSAFSNVMYMLKILWDGSRGFVIYTFIKEFTENVFWTFFSVYITEWIYIAIEKKTSYSALLSFVAAMCLCHICIHISAAIHQLVCKQLIPEIYRNFYKRVIRKSISMDYINFEEPDFYDKYTRALNECQQRGIDILNYAAFFVAGVACMITAVIMVVDVDPVLLIFIFPMVFISMFFGKKCGNLYYQLDYSNTHDGRVGAYAKRVFYEKKYAGELRLFSISRLLLAFHEKAFESMQNRSRITRKKIVLYETLKWVLFNILSVILPYFYIATVLNKREASIAAYIAMIPALSTLSWRTSDVAELLVSLAKESTFVTNLREFLNIRTNAADTKLKRAEILGAIEIKNMGFTYKGAQHATLHNVTLSIKKGEKIAIVGQNGAGKTTLVKLLMGLYQVSEGEIRVSGCNINEYDPKSFHNRIGTVFQDLQVFALPLSQNVLMHKPQNEEERKLVEESLCKAQFGEKLAQLEHGIDTMVTKEFDEDGMGLSGGEAQKIAIARIFARKPDIVILDEPSSALDPIAEYRMYQNMLKATDGETVIFISHRLSATKDADRIYLFENGTVKEQGSHTELMQLGGSYAHMWKIQAQNYLAEEVEQ